MGEDDFMPNHIDSVCTVDTTDFYPTDNKLEVL